MLIVRPQDSEYDRMDENQGQFDDTRHDIVRVWSGG